MSYLYRVATLPETNGIPAFPIGTVSRQEHISGYFVVYALPVNRRRTALAVLYRDPSGKYLVGAEPEVIIRIPVSETLSTTISKSPSGWHTWKCNTDMGDGVLLKTSKMRTDVSNLNPIIDGSIKVFGGIPTAVYSLGKFKPEDIEQQVTWIGDKTTTELEIIK